MKKRTGGTKTVRKPAKNATRPAKKAASAKNANRTSSKTPAPGASQEAQAAPAAALRDHSRHSRGEGLFARVRRYADTLKAWFQTIVPLIDARSSSHSKS